jgi:CDP-diacylglycerol---glycerol-3-phosphate 3-phosphatidyltransferase
VTGSLVSAGTRERVRGMVTPIATALGRLGLTPNALTVIGFLGACLAAVAAAFGAWLLAGALVLVFGVFDLLDGTLARATGRASRFGAFLDSTLDRAGEAVVYIGIAGGSLASGFQLGAVLAAAAMGSAFMVSYTRAKAESLGFSSGSGLANIGLAPREVRIAILSIGLVLTGAMTTFIRVDPAFCPDLFDGSATGRATFFDCLFRAQQLPGDTVLGATLGLITILATLTTFQRVLHVRAQAKEG